LNSDEWVSVSDDLPMIERGRTYVSVDVIAKTGSGKEIHAFYDYGHEEWYKVGSGRHIGENVVAWKSVKRNHDEH